MEPTIVLTEKRKVLFYRTTTVKEASYTLMVALKLQPAIISQARPESYVFKYLRKPITIISLPFETE